MQVWHRSNWHWYLKHQRAFPNSEHQGRVLVRWDDQHAGRLHTVTGAGCYEMTQLQWQQCVSPMGTSMVVDGKQLLITPLRYARHRVRSCRDAHPLMLCQGIVTAGEVL